MIKKLYILVLLIFQIGQGQTNVSETRNFNNSPLEHRPKLVVGIVVDQMRYDYLTRFYDRFGEGGFKRLMSEGFNCRNNHYNYVPTYTGPGHASIFTGTTPKYHGIIGNNWYDKATKQSVYCVKDDSVTSVGTEGYNGEMSPHRLNVTTFTDENRLFTQMRGKTIGISLKDRGAVLPAGHTANGAYWFEGSNGHWVSSSYYMEDLPNWVKEFNSSEKSESYLKPWNTLYPIETYIESGEDKNDFETIYEGKTSAEFPYDLKVLSQGDIGQIRATPYGNSLTADFAIAALEGEKLGNDIDTDVLTISFSSTDYIGHRYGVNSKEVEDAYLRLDKDLERLLLSLDASLGKNNYLLFLTSDHGAIEVPAYLASEKIPAGYFDFSAFQNRLNGFLSQRFAEDSLIESISNNQIFINRETLQEKEIDLKEVEQAIINEIINYENIDKVYSSQSIQVTSYDIGLERLLSLGYNQKRSGDILFVLDPTVIAYGRTGSTHGSSLNFDTHVPLIFYGKGIKAGSTYERTEITDIAPTMSALMGIGFPNASIGRVLEYVFKD